LDGVGIKARRDAALWLSGGDTPPFLRPGLPQIAFRSALQTISTRPMARLHLPGICVILNQRKLPVKRSPSKGGVQK
jgi:hypothetical protein